MNVIPMTYEEEGVYFALCRLFWLHGGLPANLDRLRLLLKGRPSLKIMTRWWATIGPCWLERDGKLYHPRLERERDKQQAWKAEQASKAKAAADARWDAQRMRDASHAGMLADASSSSSSFASASASAEEPNERALSLVTTPREGLELSSGQLQAAVSGLVGAWNNVAATLPQFTAVTIRSHPKATAALRAHPDINWWADVFARVAASDFLKGLIPMSDGRTFVADFFWVLGKADEIHAGRYDNREQGARNAASLATFLKDLA
jgi:uncharacterized protein YdaU (DUF1376 family)